MRSPDLLVVGLVSLVSLMAFGPFARADLVPAPAVHQRELPTENLAILFPLLPAKSEVILDPGPGDAGRRIQRRIYRAARQTGGRRQQIIRDRALVCYKDSPLKTAKWRHDTSYACHELLTNNMALPQDDGQLVALIKSERKNK